MTPPPLRHADPARSDERLAADAAAHLSKNPGLQLVAELYARLREMAFPWWTPDQLRDAFSAAQRLSWFAERPDIRQRITSALTGLAPKAARNKSPDFQASLIDSVIDEQDITIDAFESAFEAADLAVYAPAAEIFRLFRRRMPWDDDSTPHQDLVGWLIGALLADKSFLDGAPRTPILSAVQVRTAIDGRVWHSRIPLHVRVAIDDARFAAQKERSTEPYGVERDLAIATPALIAASIPLRDLLGVMDVATQALGFEDGAPPARANAREASSRSTAPARSENDDGPRSDEPPAPEASLTSYPEIEVRAPMTEPPPFMDEQTSGPETHNPFDELEHTNPWLVPNLSGELGQIANELRDKPANGAKRADGEAKKKTDRDG